MHEKDIHHPVSMQRCHANMHDKPEFRRRTATSTLSFKGPNKHYNTNESAIPSSYTRPPLTAKFSSSGPATAQHLHRNRISRHTLLPLCMTTPDSVPQHRPACHPFNTTQQRPCIFCLGNIDYPSCQLIAAAQSRTTIDTVWPRARTPAKPA